MYKSLKISLLICIPLCFWKCSNNKSSFTRETRIINKEGLFGVDTAKWNNDSIMTLTAKSIESAFNLPSINNSSAENEIRIYFVSPFYERFFRQQFKSDSLIVELTNCKVDRRKDTIFMKIGTLIKSEGIYDKDKLINGKGLPALKHLTKDSTGEVYLDGDIFYFIQIKNGSETKMIYISNPAERAIRDTDAKHIVDFIEQLRQKYSFDFNKSWDKIMDSAFVKL